MSISHPELPASWVEKVERELPCVRDPEYWDVPCKMNDPAWLRTYTACSACEKRVAILALFAEREVMWGELDEAWQHVEDDYIDLGRVGREARDRITAARRALELEP